MLKKLVFAVLASFIICNLAFSEDKLIPKSQLLKKSLDFLSKNFSKADASTITISEIGNYTVLMDNGAKIVFNRAGEWKSIENYTNPLSTKLLPHKGINDYLKSSYPKVDINRIQRESNISCWDYYVDLANGIKLLFDEEANVIKVER